MVTVEMHSFSPRVAKELGVPAALILSALRYWTDYNEKNGKNFREGRTWVYNSFSAWQGFFEYLSVKQIRLVLKTLQDEGFILVEKFSEDKMNRVNWYALTEKALALLTSPEKWEEWRNGAFAVEGKCICPTRQMHLPHRADAFAPQGECVVTSTLEDTSTIQYDSSIQQFNNEKEKSAQAQAHTHAREEAVLYEEAVAQNLSLVPDVKYIFGCEKNVLLTVSEYEQLLQFLKYDLIRKSWIDDFSRGLVKYGYQYASHYRAILDWIAKARVEAEEEDARAAKEFQCDRARGLI